MAYNSIYLKDFQPSVIKANDFSMLSNYAINASDDNFKNFAIVADQSNSDAIVCLDIINNIVGLYTTGILRSGIMIRNCNWNPLDDESHCIVQNNSIYFSNLNPTTEFHFGIYIAHSNYANISNNLFYTSLAASILPNASYHEHLKGILISSTQNATVSKNQIKRMGDGIYVDATSLGSQYFCNDLDKNWYGFYFNYALMSDQLISPTPFGNNSTSDNYWYDIPPVSSTSALRRLSGNVSSTLSYWYHRATTNDYNNIYSPYLCRRNPEHPLYGVLYPMSDQAGNSECSSVINPASTFAMMSSGILEDSNTLINSTGLLSGTQTATAVLRENLMGKIVKNSATYNYLPQQSNYMAKEFAFKLLDKTPAYLNLGTCEDNIYQNFYALLNNSNIGKFNQIGKYIHLQNYAAALSLNQTLTGINIIENNRIAVNSIYLDKVINNLPISYSDSLMLVNIAYQLPSTGGNAVFSARVMLGIDPIIGNISYAKSIHDNESNKISSTTSINVYPNPANNTLHIELDAISEESATIDIYDLNGRLCYHTSINCKQKLQTINISSITKGIYNLQITTTAQTKNQKLVIIK
jgi:hypothetical protein